MLALCFIRPIWEYLEDNIEIVEPELVRKVLCSGFFFFSLVIGHWSLVIGKRVCEVLRLASLKPELQRNNHQRFLSHLP
jgi:hypothetical protein